MGGNIPEWWADINRNRGRVEIGIGGRLRRNLQPISSDPLAEAPPWPNFPAGVKGALGNYDNALALQPWLESWPVAASGVHLVRGEKGGLLVASEDDAAMPLDASQSDSALPLLGLENITVAGLWNGRHFTLFAAETPIGLWYEA